MRRDSANQPSNLAPGGWIEHVDTKVGVYCDDGTMPADSELAKMGTMLEECSARRGFPMDGTIKMRARIEAAGFTNIHEKYVQFDVHSL